MLKNDLSEITLFFDLEWVPDANAARRLYDLPEGVSETAAIERMWRETKGYSDECRRPFVKYLFSRVVSIAFLSRRTVLRDGVEQVDFTLNSLPKLPLEDKAIVEAHLIERFL